MAPSRTHGRAGFVVGPLTTMCLCYVWCLNNVYELTQAQGSTLFLVCVRVIVNESLVGASVTCVYAVFERWKVCLWCDQEWEGPRSILNLTTVEMTWLAVTGIGCCILAMMTTNSVWSSQLIVFVITGADLVVTSNRRLTMVTTADCKWKWSLQSLKDSCGLEVWTAVLWLWLQLNVSLWWSEKLRNKYHLSQIFWGVGGGGVKGKARLETPPSPFPPSSTANPYAETFRFFLNFLICLAAPGSNVHVCCGDMDALVWLLLLLYLLFCKAGKESKGPAVLCFCCCLVFAYVLVYVYCFFRCTKRSKMRGGEGGGQMKVLLYSPGLGCLMVLKCSKVNFDGLFQCGVDDLFCFFPW